IARPIRAQASACSGSAASQYALRVRLGDSIKTGFGSTADAARIFSSILPHQSAITIGMGIEITTVTEIGIATEIRIATAMIGGALTKPCSLRALRMMVNDTTARATFRVRSR